MCQRSKQWKVLVFEKNVEPAKVFLQKVVARRRSSQIRRLLRPFNEKCRPILSTPHLKTFHVSRMTAYFAFFQHPKKSSFCSEPVRSGLPFLKEIFGHTSTSLFSFLWLTFGHTQHIIQQLWNRRKRSQEKVSSSTHSLQTKKLAFL